MNISSIKRVYFIGIGGIGMSALARFFAQRGAVVSGYDRTETALTKALIAEGMNVSYNDETTSADEKTELVVYTPAIPKDSTILNWYQSNNYKVCKRSDVLQWITEAMYVLTVAGTHGKTTTSTMIGYLLRETGYGCNAFLGGISANYDSNYWSSQRDTAVVEADEYDRSFLKLSPDIAVLTSMDADHLDIYGTIEEMEAAFIQYTRNIKPGGTLVVKHGLNRSKEFGGDNKLTYSLQNSAADVHAMNIVQRDGGYYFDVIGKGWYIQQVYLPIGGMHNVENCVAAIAITQLLQIDGAAVKADMKNFRGVHRRFEYVIRTEQLVYIDDYAHHPEELSTLISSAKKLFPKMPCVIVFQPHLFSRTRDLADGFAESLSLADKVLLLDIYPAREQPMEGITASTIGDKINGTPATILTKAELLDYLKAAPAGLFITAGAGDIDKLVMPIKEILNEKVSTANNRSVTTV